MRSFIITLTLLSSFCQAAVDSKTWYTFHYKTKDSLSISVRADSKEEAFSMASKECFRILTKGTYQGEAESLNIIDICANPK